MCGRYSPGKRPENWPEENQPFFPRFNIAPSQEAPIFLSDGSVKMLRWGLVPSWAREGNAEYKMINARAETVAQKRAFRGCLQRKRCGVPADSFYEWRKERKQPVRFLLRDEEPFLFAGLWEECLQKDGATLQTFTIITTEANDLVRPLRDRMPVILTDSSAAEWLNGTDLATARLPALLCPFPADRMSSYPVSKRLNDALWDDPACIKPFAEPEPMLPGFGSR